MNFSFRSNAGYLAALAVVSGVILILGVVFRPKHTPVPTISEAERIQLQNLAQRQALQRRNVVLAEYAGDLSVRGAGVLREPSAVPYVEPRPGEMLIVVAVVDSGRPHWITVEFAGYNSVACGNQTLTEISVDSVIPPSLARAVVFTLNETLIGVVTQCGDRLIVTDPKNYSLALAAAAEQRYFRCCGIRFAPGDGSESGRAVTELRIGSILDRAGVEVGDRIFTINGYEITSDSLLQHVLTAPHLEIDIDRSGRRSTLRYEAKPVGSGATLERTAEGSRVLQVEPGSPAAQIGLREGDIVTRAGELRRPAPAALQKVLVSRPPGAAIVVRRGDTDVLLEPAP